MPVTVAVALALGGVAVCPEAHAILRRHDVADAQYVVAAEEYPAVVDLLEPGDCLATLIAPSWLLTAAHCAEHVELPHVIRVAGQDHDVMGVVCERAYDGDVNDIALVHIDPPVDGVAPIPIYRDRDEVGQLVTFVGRGDSGTGLDGQRGAVLDLLTRRATNRVHDSSKRWLELVFESPEDPSVTALEGISGDGDSGGPAFVETSDGPRIAGVSSWQAGAEKNIGLYGAREFYTRVSRHAELVDEVTGPAWDGEYRRCRPACSVGAVGAPRHHPIGAALLALALGAGWMRARRAAATRGAKQRTGNGRRVCLEPVAIVTFETDH